MQEDQALALFKCLADRSRLQILKSLIREDMYVERLAERLALSPATVSFHLKKLEAAGAVSSRREQYYTMYAIRRDVFSVSMLSVISEVSGEADQQTQRDEAYRQKILDTFFVYGKLTSIPAQRKKRRVCLEEIARQFDVGRAYPEKEVNAILEAVHADYCALRRGMIEEGLMTRQDGVYTRTP